jgi:polyisoprenoid-binding protein YceI
MTQVGWIKRSFFPVLLLSGVEAKAETYRLLEPESFLYVETRPDGVLSKAAHPHVVRATKWTGTVKYDPASPDKCAVEISIPVEGLVVDEPVMRKRLSYTKPIADGDRKRVDESMREEDQLNASKFPKITFTSSSCKKVSEGKIEVTGALEIRGKAKQVTVPMEVQLTGGKLKAKGKFELTHEDFGFEPYSAALGTIKNDEKLIFNVRAIGVAEK